MLDLAPYVQSWMERLACRRPVFHSESDFQLALGLVLAEDMQRLRLEKKVTVSEPVGGLRRLSVDVLGELAGQRIALELKYPKKRLRVSIDGEKFDLPASGAPDLDASKIWRDVQRVERLILDDIVDAGASLTLTNYPFWGERSCSARSQAHEFRLWDGRDVDAGSLAWQLKGDRIGECLPIASAYRCNWRDYRSDSESADVGLRYLLLQPDLRPGAGAAPVYGPSSWSMRAR
ncbi:hypothetical protein [Prescottella subtropica]|uniref:hypothetical protein n=1 Tax=Prescottella subtropica TaxID=2545757 RepID=UPI0010F48961|nr:hypothetical protein [Prescottella subtropica]